MWTVRILSGPQRGQIFQLKEGRNLLGRSSSCYIQIQSHGVSKEHCEILVSTQSLNISDLNSSNGTFVNGVRIQKSKLRVGDKISLNEVMLDIQTLSPQIRASQGLSVAGAQAYYPPPPLAEVPQMQHEDQPAASFVVHHHGGLFERLWLQFKDYIDAVALPGVYKLAEVSDLKMVLMGMMGVFLVAVTLLAMIPMVSITRSSIMKESERRAKSLALTMADVTRASWGANGPGAISTTRIEVEEGVKKVMVVNQSDGSILAPASQSGVTPDLPFVHRARREKRSLTELLDGNLIAASAPIEFYDPAIGEQSVKAHAIVLYDVAGLALDDQKIISLFMQTLLLASLVGLVIFYFLFKLVERPIVVLNSQLDLALREKHDATEVPIQFAAMQVLVGNINSLLTRYHHGAENQQVGGLDSGQLNPQEIENLVQLVGYPAIAVSSQEIILSMNSGFSQILHSTLDQVRGQSLALISDMALQQNVRNLIQLSNHNPQQIQADNLEISGHNFKLLCQSVGPQNSDLNYYIIVLTPAEGGSYGSAS